MIIRLCLVIPAHAQLPATDSLKAALRKCASDTCRAMILAELGRVYQYQNTLTGLSHAYEALMLSRKTDFPKGEIVALNALGNNYRRSGNYEQALLVHIEALRIAEQLQDVTGMAAAYHGLSTVHEDQGDHKEALAYAYKVLPLAAKLNDQSRLMRIQSNMGKIYHSLKIMDSALHYELNAYQIALARKDFTIAGNIIGRLARIYATMGNTEMAMFYFRMAIPYAIEKNDNNALTEVYMGIAEQFHQHGQIDSALFYGYKTLEPAMNLKSPGDMIIASRFISSIYQGKGNTDSAFKYVMIAVANNDTFVTREKLKHQQLLAFEEQKRQEEKLQAVEIQIHERNTTIEYTAIAIGLITLLILFFLLSNSIIVNEKWVRIFSVLALLITFEFINLLLHPWLVKITNHSPVLMLLTMVCIAAVLVPFHHWLEKWIKEKMVEKNNRIRLAAAKKIIAELERSDAPSDRSSCV